MANAFQGIFQRFLRKEMSPPKSRHLEFKNKKCTENVKRIPINDRDHYRDHAR
jgi:hypothetical protein